MKTTATCPACEQPISIWRIVSAPTPIHLSCSSCKTKIRPKGWTILSLITALAIGFALGFSLSRFYRDDQLSILGAIAIAVGVLIVVEFIWGLLICNRATLEAHSK
ncbi:MAG: hypothetical protein HQ553_10640 [Chloroflexi bacterium]|nr:hypothetical protein [Chloroflexota bacterium]